MHFPNIKRQMSCVIAAIIAVTSMGLQPMTAQAATEDVSDYDNSISVVDGGLVVTFTDKPRSSTEIPYYTTAGYTIHQVNADGTYSNASSAVAFDERSVSVKTRSDGYIETTKTISADQVKASLNSIDPTGALYTQFLSGDYGVLRLDGLMEVAPETGGTQSTIIGYNADGTSTFTYNKVFTDPSVLNKKFSWVDENGVKHTSTIGEVIGSDGVFDMFSEEELAAMCKVYNWSAKTIKALMASHSNKRIKSATVPPSDTPLPDEDQKDSGTDAAARPVYNHMSGSLTPTYYTWNETDQFKLGEGIPSGESYTNHVMADAWYGLYDWEEISGHKDYKVPVKIHGYEKYYYRDRNDLDEDGEPKLKQGLTPWDDSTEVEVRRYFKFRYIKYLDLRGLSSAVVINGSFDGNKNYTFKNTAVTAIHNGTDIQKIIQTETTDQNIAAHIQDPSIPDIDIDVGEKDKSASDSILNSYKSRAESLGQIKTWNDTLIINGKTYMDGTINEKETAVPKDIIDADRNDVQEKQTVTIPQQRANGYYPTSGEFNYIRLKPLSGTAVPARPINVPNNIYPAYAANEPVVVHTPVISPVTITTGGTKASDTQLTDPNSTGGSEWTNLADNEKDYLLLDHEYTFKFDPWKWMQSISGYSDAEMIAKFGRDLQGYGESGEPSKYDKYVKEKRVKFPFDVAVNGVFYSADQDDGYTQWIDLGSHAYEVKFYIPSWATESTTKFAASDGIYTIKFEVQAYNTFDDRLNNHEKETEETENGIGPSLSADTSKYVATYQIPVNLSGIVYNFQVVGSTNKDIYAETPDDGNFHDQNIAFCLSKQEKKSGTKNRLGGTSVRYTLDNTLTKAWDELNTIPLSKGRSKQYSDMGAMWTGQTFAYSLQTIANLADANDRIQITPTLRYVATNGATYSGNDIQFYYMTDEGGNFVRFGSAQDANYSHKVYLGQEMFNGSYQSSDVSYSANKYYSSYTDPEKFYLKNKVTSYTQSAITLKDTLRLLTGNLLYIGKNLDKNPGSASSLQDLYGSDTHNIVDLDTKLHDSMQTWYGQYWVPNDLYVVKTSDLKGCSDLTEYAKKYGGISTDDKIWQKTGYVVINFDIKTINEGKSHLSYSGMWDTEGFTTSAHTGGTPDITIPTKKGDVAIVELGHSIQDKYSGRILFID